MARAQEDEVVSALYSMVETVIDSKQHAIVQGTWNYAETVDANLSSVTVSKREYRYVPKGAHVTGLVAGDPVLCVYSPGTSLTIIGKIVGDISLAGQ